MNLISFIQFSLSAHQIWNYFDTKNAFFFILHLCGEVKLRLHWKILSRVQCVGEFFAQLLYRIVTRTMRISTEKIIVCGLYFLYLKFDSHDELETFEFMDDHW